MCAQADPTCQRLRGLRKRAPERVALARVASIVRAGRYGLYEDGMALFKAVDEVGLADIRHHEAALWSCPTYEEQTDLWAVTDRIRAEKGCVLLLVLSSFQSLLMAAALIAPASVTRACPTALVLLNAFLRAHVHTRTTICLFSCNKVVS